jgi:hypothetical protein
VAQIYFARSGSFLLRTKWLIFTPRVTTLTDEQASALVLGLPWQRLGDAGVIDCI